ncbi:MAG: 23S rRNA pseudouridine(1911/1915/1917) synthase RluD [Candidatus Dasytiphilus stammeri]
MMQSKKITAMISERQIGQRLDKILVELFPKYSRCCLKKWILGKKVLLENKIFDKPKTKIKNLAKIVINVPIDPDNFVQAQQIDLNIIYEDDDILILNKPMNLVVHPGAGNNHYRTLLNGLLYYYPKIISVPRAGIVHRLDKNTTGLMIIAKTPLVQQYLVESIKKRHIIRQYEAIIIGVIRSEGFINQSISRDPNKRTLMKINSLTGKSAITHYRVLERFRAHTHIFLQLETGRTHQIRVHMAYINHPLVGDNFYPGHKTLHQLPPNISLDVVSQLNAFNRQALHASHLSFYHPIRKIYMEYKAPLPQDMLDLISVLRADKSKSIQSKT